jgi:hypothetical protein
VTIIYHNDNNRQAAPQSLTSQSSHCPMA